MSKSLGNFFTVRDLMLDGHKPSSIRYLLASVSYRNPLNFTFDGLRQAATAVERLRNFQLRLRRGRFPAGANLTLTRLAAKTRERIREALDDDLNAAQAQAAIFDMVRTANAMIDSGEIQQGDAQVLLAALEEFDEIFAVLNDDDAAKMRLVADWARREGREQDISPELAALLRSAELSDDEINRRVAEMKQAREQRDFPRSDRIRSELVGAGIVIEQTKEGVRWRRK